MDSARLIGLDDEPFTVTFSMTQVENCVLTMLPFAVLVYLFRRILTTWVLPPLALKCWRLKLIAEKKPLKGEGISHDQDGEETEEQDKMCESLWRITWHSTVSCYGFYMLWTTKRDCLMDALNCALDSKHDVRPWEEQVYYSLQFASYVNLLYQELKHRDNKDFLVMFLHHVVTLVVIVYAAGIKQYSVVSLLIFLHDISDPVLEASKILRRIGSDLPSIICFAVFTLIWICTRVIYLPMKVIFGLYHYAWDPSIIPQMRMNPIIPRSMATILCLLYVMHLIWTWFILRVYINFFTGKGSVYVTSPTTKRKATSMKAD